ncbi:hypothetical protein ALO81_200253 [Pseudomonas cannabina]|uniref:Putative DNA primase/helicase n=1 Tax=Pseudomonas cannabina TaxID=86840 RepID=A0A0P9R6J3_PSECA|nr:hypothetical protein ALO81_200253 [Pseudomonas cannabina]
MDFGFRRGCTHPMDRAINMRLRGISSREGLNVLSMSLYFCVFNKMSAAIFFLLNKVPMTLLMVMWLHALGLNCQSGIEWR